MLLINLKIYGVDSETIDMIYDDISPFWIGDHKWHTDLRRIVNRKKEILGMQW